MLFTAYWHGILLLVIVPNRANTNFYCGTSNVVLPVPNKSHYPEEYRDRSRLCYYASIFNSVEVNSSFYKIPMPRTVERWTAEVPDHFRFTFKLWKGITHNKELVYDPVEITRFFNAISPAGVKKGAVLIQFPGSIKFSSFPKLRRLLDDVATVPESADWKLAIEFRDKSWYNDTVYQLLENYKAGVVIHDIPASYTPLIDMNCCFAYLRFHGERGDYRGSYEDDVLWDYADNIKDWLKQKKTVFAYFNNTMGSAVHNAITLKKSVK